MRAHQNEFKQKKLTKPREERKDFPESYCREKENSLIHEHLFLGVAGNEKIHKDLSTARKMMG